MRTRSQITHTHTAHFNYTHDQSFSPHGVVVIICAENSSVGHHWHLLKETQRRIRSPTEKATVRLPNGSRILTQPSGIHTEEAAHSNHKPQGLHRCFCQDTSVKPCEKSLSRYTVFSCTTLMDHLHFKLTLAIKVTMKLKSLVFGILEFILNDSLL